jgi:hypothetical protein
MVTIRNTYLPLWHAIPCLPSVTAVVPSIEQKLTRKKMTWAAAAAKSTDMYAIIQGYAGIVSRDARATLHSISAK